MREEIDLLKEKYLEMTKKNAEESKLYAMMGAAGVPPKDVEKHMASYRDSVNKIQAFEKKPHS